MKQYKQLTTGQRYQIYGLKQSGLNQTQIALIIGVNKSTISREFMRNKGKRGWRPSQAQSLRDERKQACNNGKQFTLSDWAEVDHLIRQDLSPEQAANRLMKWLYFTGHTNQGNMPNHEGVSNEF